MPYRALADVLFNPVSGTIGGLTATILPFIQTIQLVASTVGVVCGALVAAISLYRLLRGK